MATYAIGDLQGCYKEFRQLLDMLTFDAVADRLWLVGDVVNRGPESLTLLRFVKSLGDSVVMVLGNHDLHLLMVAGGYAKQHGSDTFQDILNAPDRDDLLDWLRKQRLMYVENNSVMVHAGLLPSWSIAQAEMLAKEVESALRGSQFHEFLSHMYGNQPDRWDDSLTGYDRLRVVTNAMTRMRVSSSDGRMNFAFKGQLKDIPTGYLPWFEMPHRVSQDVTVICGHWSALGLQIKDNLIALDTGCLWGGSLTAVRLEDREVFQVACEAPAGITRWR
jgi:bis(5'-nucleosyl)-tetraphosphatase (symmetrical)